MSADKQDNSSVSSDSGKLDSPLPDLAIAQNLIANKEFSQAETLIRDAIKREPKNALAMRLLGDLAVQLNRTDDASKIFELCLSLDSDYHLARENYIAVLLQQQRLDKALDQSEKLLKVEPNRPNFLLLKATILMRKLDFLEAKRIYHKVFSHFPEDVDAQMRYGHLMKTLGDTDNAVKAYRRVIALRPGDGEAYWSLANLKTFKFNNEDIALMQDQLPCSETDDDFSKIAFSLGKALEDNKFYNQSFAFYEKGNDKRSLTQKYDADDFEKRIESQITTFSHEYFEAIKGSGCANDDPIFIVGLPRSGSTLIEQILSSHSQVEGTSELPDIPAISRQLDIIGRNSGKSSYPSVLKDISKGKMQEIGNSYLDSTRIQRKDSPFFIDKMPNNFEHIGLIHAILPKAKIIDVRRHPMACCFSGYKQFFAKGQTFTYQLKDAGHYYRHYIELMKHWEKVLPSRILRVQYEDIVADSEIQIRRVLDYCGLPFEEQCLRFYETDRAIRTPSSEQVRLPIYNSSVEHWRNYESFLAPLKSTLSDALDDYEKWDETGQVAKPSSSNLNTVLTN
jgi:tetratricopeptide (TPR) repeat protein